MHSDKDAPEDVSHPVALIEDDEECAAACALTLQRSGRHVCWYPTARAALVAARGGTELRLVLMDLELPGESSFAAMAELRALCPDVQLIAWTSHAGDDYLLGALRAGAVAYLLKHDSIDSLPRMLTEVEHGGSPMSPGIARRVLATFATAPAPAPACGPPGPADEAVAPLTQREQEVVTLLARGCSYPDCARMLGIALDTVRTHVRHCYDKLNACTKAEAVAEAFRQGLVR